MALIQFQDLPNATTPFNATNLNNNFNECNNIVESGSNTNGSFIKYSDGTMICYKTLMGTVNITTALWTNWYYGEVQLGNFPQAFIERPTINVSPQTQSGTQYFLTGNAGGAYGTATSGGIVCMLRPNQRENLAYVLDMIAIGKWK